MAMLGKHRNKTLHILGQYFSIKYISTFQFPCNKQFLISLGLPGILQNAHKKGVGLVNRP